MYLKSLPFRSESEPLDPVINAEGFGMGCFAFKLLLQVVWDSFWLIVNGSKYENILQEIIKWTRIKIEKP